MTLKQSKRMITNKLTRKNQKRRKNKKERKRKKRIETLMINLNE